MKKFAVMDCQGLGEVMVPYLHEYDLDMHVQ